MIRKSVSLKFTNLFFLLLFTDRVHIAVFFQLRRDNEYVTLCDTRQTHEDQTRRDYGNKAYPLIATLKPQSNGPSYSNAVIGTLAVDGWAVTFGTARRDWAGPQPAHPLLATRIAFGV